VQSNNKRSGAKSHQRRANQSYQLAYLWSPGCQADVASRPAGQGGAVRAAGGGGRVPDSRAAQRRSLSALRIFRRRRGRERTLSAPRSGRRTGLGPLSAATGVAASPRYRHCNRAGLGCVRWHAGRAPR